MPASFMNPASVLGIKGTSVGGFGSSSALPLSQPNMMRDQLNPVEMTQNTSESELARVRDDFESKSGSENHEGISGEDQDQNQHPNRKKKRYHRHTQHQIQEMEAFFRECPHPDDKQRKELGSELGLEPLQIKFWFQNKRTQMKTHHERNENTHLRAENEKLRMYNIRYREALSNASCPHCGGPTTIGEVSCDEQHLRMENTRLREEIGRMSTIAAKYAGKPVLDFPLISSPIHNSHPIELGVSNYGEMYGAGGLFRPISSAATQPDKPMIIELAVAAMEELIKMAHTMEPLWSTSIDGIFSTLNEEEYVRTFPHGIGPRPDGFRSEATRETTVVIMNHLNLVEILMDVNQWSSIFSSIVSRAMTLEVLSTGLPGNYNGALQVMTAEYHVPTPLVPTRESYFARYCKEHGEGTWVVVDVSLDSLRPSTVVRCRRRPSGCLIREMPNGYSKVIWVEHVEVSDGGVHSLYKQLVNSGSTFGAKRWVATLDRQCERLASAMASNIYTGDISALTSQEGKKSMMKLAERMVMSFCAGVSASTARMWTTLSGTGADDVKVMTRKSIDEPGRPQGIVLSTATSFWLPASPKRVFDFLRDKKSRNEWDILSNGGIVEEIACMTNDRETGNCTSLLRSENSSQGNMLILQESCCDSTGSLVIYAPVDAVSMNAVLNGGESDYVAILPSGFAIHPDGSMTLGRGIGDEVRSRGSLLTVAFQILVDPVPTSKLSVGSVATVNNLIACTVERIKASLSCHNA